MIESDLREPTEGGSSRRLRAAGRAPPREPTFTSDSGVQQWVHYTGATLREAFPQKLNLNTAWDPVSLATVLYARRHLSASRNLGDMMAKRCPGPDTNGDALQSPE